jgi:hypothetical protein
MLTRIARIIKSFVRIIHARGGMAHAGTGKILCVCPAMIIMPAYAMTTGGLNMSGFRVP